MIFSLFFSSAERSGSSSSRSWESGPWARLTLVAPRPAARTAAAVAEKLGQEIW